MNYDEYVKNKIKEIGLKRLEYDGLQAMFAKYGSEIDEKYRKILEENGIPFDFVTRKQEDSKCCCSVPAQNDDHFTVLSEHEKLRTDLFKHLALVTHPDKNNESKDDFLLIHAAYENHDTFMLLEYAIKYNVRKENICDEMMTLILEKKMNKIIQKIENTKKTIAYHLLVHGNVDEHIANLKTLQRIDAENQELREKNRKLEEELKNK
uniref:J domain-containing protein n=1 Tax=viral metagenome TaxID=1070528 RepID=A0A6C0C897_9ZZZZ